MATPVSLIIAVYNKPDFLEKVLTSVGHQTYRSFEIRIADDGSDEQVSAILSKFKELLPMPIRHIRHEDNGFQKTIIANKAVAAAAGEYLIFIDGDCILHRRFIERHFCHRQKGAVLAGRRVMLSEAGTKSLRLADIDNHHIESPLFWWNRCLPRQRKHGFYIPFSFSIENFFKKRYWITGANFSMHKEDFASINGYDETITGRGGEDINLTERVRLKGLSIKTITREALQYHLYHTSAPVPHDRQVFERLSRPQLFWAEHGLSGHLPG
jgi:hypothetical protein